MASSQWIGWQLVDTAFPSGAFAHSAGLEAAWQAGIVPDESALAAFARDAVTQAARQSLPFMLAVHGRPECFTEVDGRVEATLTNHVANRTSRAQGRALLHAAEAIYSEADLDRWLEPIRAARTPGHLAPVFGLLTRRLDLPEHDARLLFCYQQLRTICSAAVRLGVVGPLRAQALQHQLAEHTEQVAQVPADAQTWQTMPVADMLQSGQDRLYSRLFQS